MRERVREWDLSRRLCGLHVLWLMLLLLRVEGRWVGRLRRRRRRRRMVVDELTLLRVRW